MSHRDLFLGSVMLVAFAFPLLWQGCDDVGGDRRAAGGELGKDRGLQVAEDRHGDGARDRGRGHHQDVRRVLALGPEGVAPFIYFRF